MADRSQICRMKVYTICKKVMLHIRSIQLVSVAKPPALHSHTQRQMSSSPVGSRCLKISWGLVFRVFFFFLLFSYSLILLRVVEEWLNSQCESLAPPRPRCCTLTHTHTHTPLKPHTHLQNSKKKNTLIPPSLPSLSGPTMIVREVKNHDVSFF